MERNVAEQASEGPGGPDHRGRGAGRLDARPVLTGQDELRQRVEELEELLGQRITWPSLPRVRRIEWRLLGLLLRRRGVVTRESAFTVLYGDRMAEEQPSNLHIIDTHVSRLNAGRALRDLGVRVQTDRANGGYYLRQADRLALEKRIEEGDA